MQKMRSPRVAAIDTMIVMVIPETQTQTIRGVLLAVVSSPPDIIRLRVSGSTRKSKAPALRYLHCGPLKKSPPKNSSVRDAPEFDKNNKKIIDDVLQFRAFIDFDLSCYQGVTRHNYKCKDEMTCVKGKDHYLQKSICGNVSVFDVKI